MRSTFGCVALRSRCTPKMFMPARASARLVASPNPEEAPSTSAQPWSLIASASVIRAILASRRVSGHPWAARPAAARVIESEGMPKTAGIVLVGNEILSGKIADANATFLCRELRALGVGVVPDDVELIAEEVGRPSRSYDVVFTSGGVGPTHDDVTIEGVARAMAVKVVRHARLVAVL